jgi:hypothetical protein
MISINPLFSHELEALLEALRRDLRAERDKAKYNSPYADLHLYNARNSLRLLEVLNPRGPHRTMYPTLLASAYS